MSAFTQLFTLVYGIFITWITVHPNATLAIGAFELVDSLIAAKLPTPQDNDSRAYHVTFIVVTAFAVSYVRAIMAWNVLRGNAKVGVKQDI